MHTLETYSFSDTAIRKGIDNTIPKELEVTAKFTLGCIQALEVVLGYPIIQLSGYRGRILNTVIQAKNITYKISQHEKAEAIDFICPTFGTPEDIVNKLRIHPLPFDQLIMEGKWVHISFTLHSPRREVLKATFTNGKASYEYIK